MSKRELTPVQKRNLEALHLKKDILAEQYGNKITILTTDEEAVSMDGFLAIPVSELVRDGDKQLIMKCAVVVEDERTGERYLKYDADETPAANDTEDVMDAIKRTIEAFEERNRKAIDRSKLPKKREEVVMTIPKGYKLVKIDAEEDTIIPDTAEASTPVAEEADMGKILPSKKSAKKDSIKAMLMELLSELDDEE